MTQGMKMTLKGGPADGMLIEDTPGLWVEIPFLPSDADAHCFSYRGPVCLGSSPTIARYSVLGDWVETRCSCGEVVATKAEDPPGPPRAHPPAP